MHMRFISPLSISFVINSIEITSDLHSQVNIFIILLDFLTNRPWRDHGIDRNVSGMLLTDLKNTILELIDFAFKKNKKNYIAFNSFRAFWSVREVKRYKCLTAKDLKDLSAHHMSNWGTLFINRSFAFLGVFLVHLCWPTSSLWCMNINLWKNWKRTIFIKHQNSTSPLDI